MEEYTKVNATTLGRTKVEPIGLEVLKQQERMSMRLIANEEENLAKIRAEIAQAEALGIVEKVEVVVEPAVDPILTVEEPV